MDSYRLWREVLPLSFLFILGCSGTQNLKNNVNRLFEDTPGTYALAYKNLDNGEEILINASEEFHAASTMKTPVMLEVFRQVEAGKWSLSSNIPVKNAFRSIVDGSIYTLSPEDDSEQTLYLQLGTYKTLETLLNDMIVVSSNLATNMVIELVGPQNVMQTMKDIGANDIQVLRGVEDIKAYDQGLNNTTTALDLLRIFEEIAQPTLVTPSSSAAMIRILKAQKFNEIIPGKLPADVEVAHKTGRISTVEHDSGIVFLPDGQSYVLVLLSKDFNNRDTAIETMATVSKMVYEHLQ